jgi:hypothetical protein
MRCLIASSSPRPLHLSRCDYERERRRCPAAALLAQPAGQRLHPRWHASQERLELLIHRVLLGVRGETDDTSHARREH